MNIQKQLSLLASIKEHFKTKLLEIGANIIDNTPFSEYPKFIKLSEKTVFMDKLFFSINKKEKTKITLTDSHINSENEKDIIGFNISESVEYYKN